MNISYIQRRIPIRKFLGIALFVGVLLGKADERSSQPKHPKNLARAHLGTQIMVHNPSNEITHDLDEATRAFLSEDPTIHYRMPPGRTSFALILPGIENINRFTLQNFSAEGTVCLSVSSTLWPLDSSKWNRAGDVQQLQRGRISMDTGFREAKYIKIDFDITRSGEIGNFGLFGSADSNLFRLVKKTSAASSNTSSTPSPDSINYNLAASYSPSHVIFTSSGDSSKDPDQMLSDASTTGYSFDPKDTEPTLILDLKEKRDLRKVVVQLDAPPGRLSFYLLENLPRESQTSRKNSPHFRMASIPKLNWSFGSSSQMNSDAKSATTFSQESPSLNRPATSKILSSYFKNHDPIQMAETGPGHEQIFVDFSVRPARYLMLRWEDPSALNSKSLVLFQVCVFGTQGSKDLQVEPTYDPLLSTTSESTEEPASANPDDLSSELYRAPFIPVASP